MESVEQSAAVVWWSDRVSADRWDRQGPRSPFTRIGIFGTHRFVNSVAVICREIRNPRPPAFRPQLGKAADDGVRVEPVRERLPVISRSPLAGRLRQELAFAVAAEVLGRCSARRGGEVVRRSRLPLETITEKGGAAVASATASIRSTRHASWSSGTTPLQIRTAESHDDPPRACPRVARVARFREHGAGEPERSDLRAAEGADDRRVGENAERFGRRERRVPATRAAGSPGSCGERRGVASGPRADRG
jgi:hypothetical protein